MADDELMSRDEIELAIQRASEKTPKIRLAREKIDRAVGGIDSEKGMQLLAEAIRRMMRQA